jgi:Glycosyltransferases involved in cell wall biogenesis
MGMKTVSIVVPTYNEEENIRLLSEEVIRELGQNLADYDYELIFIDNNSKDNTRNIIRELCKNNPKIKAIFNLKNFGPDNSPYYGLLQATGECAILLCADFQDPIDMLPQMVREWEKGYKVITAIKKTSKENPVMRLFRTIYYKLIRKMADTEIIEHFTGFGLYDKEFLDILRKLDDPIPLLRGVVAEFGENRLEVPYEQQKRRAGKSHIKFFTLYDVAMRSFTSYTKVGLRLATFVGFFVALLSFIIAMVYLVIKLCNWYAFNMGTAPILIGLFFLGSVQLIFMGLMGEYIISINRRAMKRPLVVESERINFEETVK